MEIWRAAEESAMEERGEKLGIFDVKHEKAPTLAEISLRLTDTKESSKVDTNIVNWLSDGIKAQNDQ